MKHAKVLMLGTDIPSPGGIASVVIDYFDFGLMSRLNIQYVPTFREGSKLTKVLFFLWHLPKIFIKMTPAKIVHVHAAQGWSFRRLVSLLYVAHLVRKKTVLHVHASQFDIYYERAGRVERAFIRYGLRFADVVIVLSKDWKEKLLAIEPRTKIAVVRNGVDYAKYRQLEERELRYPVTILSLGRLGERKGTYDLLNAAQALGGAGFKFVLAGDGDVEQVRNLVLERGLDDFVCVPGLVGQEEKNKLLGQADVYVLPSYHEGLPISILEAMVAGLPVVSTPVGGIPEAVIEGRTGYLTPPGDFQTLASCIERIVANPLTWRRMSDASIVLARENFSMEMVESELGKIYVSLTS